ncbi:hypothetical protein Vretimale_15790 [Volvox reticuliferus]|uniref:Uncharacterized protein n=1 Tax=Volvox reticuliferus TaxID=1737510 RepID=A0A8J4CZG4_9CHLO|nr:hypothetical protein Vretifemale_18477 [Volvox reticuliferus]GIM12443.1 hypothetical protein Vretimale_15790 [Volvox reticuliferus]
MAAGRSAYSDPEPRLALSATIPSPVRPSTPLMTPLTRGDAASCSNVLVSYLSRWSKCDRSSGPVTVLPFSLVIPAAIFRTQAAPRFCCSRDASVPIGPVPDADWSLPQEPLPTIVLINGPGGVAAALLPDVIPADVPAPATALPLITTRAPALQAAASCMASCSETSQQACSSNLRSDGKLVGSHSAP